MSEQLLWAELNKKQSEKWAMFLAKNLKNTVKCEHRI